MGRIKKYNTETELNEAKKIARKKYVLKNKDKVLLQQKKWKELKFGVKIKLTDEQKKEKVKEQKKIWAKANSKKIKESIKKWNKNNPEKLKENYNKSVKKRKSFDRLYKLKCSTRSMISKIFKRFNVNKINKSQIIIGCSYEQFKTYLESQFKLWMNWNNYGIYNGELNYGWDIDHIIPISEAKTEEDIIKLNHYTNLQPLCSKVNRDIKRNK